MSKFAERAKAVDLLFEGYFGESKGTVFALLPAHDANVLQLKSGIEVEPQPVTSTQETKIQLLQFMADGYLEQYRHYDNQRAKLAGVLVAAVAGFSIAPFALSESLAQTAALQTTGNFEQFRQSLVFLSTFVLIAIALLGWIASRKHRLRMKSAYKRYKRVLSELERVVGDVNISEIHTEGDAEARDEFANEDIRGETDRTNKEKSSSGKIWLDDWTRGIVWSALPWVVIFYALTYCFLYARIRYGG